MIEDAMVSEELFQSRRLRSFKAERIVLLIDNHNYVKSNCQGWNSNNNCNIVTNNSADNDSTILDCIKSYLHVFIQRKLRTAMKHEIAIISFDENNVILHTKFTTNDKTLNDSIRNIDNNDHIRNLLEKNSKSIVEENSLNEIFNYVIDILELPSVSSSNDNINLRFILIYGRFYSPKISESIPRFLSNSWVYIDVLYLHPKVTKLDDDEENYDNDRYQDIFDNLATFQQLASQVDNDITEINYIFDSHNSSLKLSAIITALLAHSATRETQHELLAKLDRKIAVV